MMTTETVVVAGQDQVSVELNNESVILHSPSGTYFGLDEVGGRIWQLVQQPIAVKAILEMLVEEFEVDSDQCRSDLLRFLADIEKEGLLRVESDGIAT